MTVSLAACGEESERRRPASARAPARRAADSALAAKVPADIKAAGKLVIGTDSTYAPNEFLDTDGKTVIGFDVDLFNAVGAEAGPDDRVAVGASSTASSRV